MVFVTGDTLASALRDFVSESGRPVIEKPFLPNEVRLTLGIKVLFFSKSVTLSVERRFSAKLGDPAFTDLYEIQDWSEYCDAFA